MLGRSLNGVRVLDFSRLFPGPLCTLMLADLGADVIKIEAPEGEPARFYPPFQFGSGTTFLQLNRGKRSLALDLKKPEAAEVIHRLLHRADILVESFRPGVMQRLGLDYGKLQPAYPRLLYCSISGYGPEGPNARKPGHDLNYISIAGLVDLTGDPGKGLLIPPVQIADLLGGFQAGMAILAGLIQRGRDQNGQHINISLLDGAFFCLISLAGMHFAGIPLRSPVLPLSGRLACYNLYRTLDDRYLALALLEPKFWQAFCKKMDLNEHADHHLTADQEKLIEILSKKIALRTLRDWLVFFQDEDLCITQVNHFEEALEQVPEQLLMKTGYPNGFLSQLKTPFVADSQATAPAPQAGQHTVEILTEIGYSFPEIETMKTRGVLFAAEVP